MTAKAPAQSELALKTIRNVSRRLVSFSCNGGEYRHLPVQTEINVSAVEIKGNAMVDKLVKRGVLSLTDFKSPSKVTAKKSASPSKSKAKKSTSPKKPGAKGVASPVKSEATRSASSNKKIIDE